MTLSPAVGGRTSGQTLDPRVVGRWLTSWVSQRLGAGVGPVTPECEVADLDLDSTEVLLLVTDLMDEFAVLVSPGEVLAHRSLATLGAAVQERAAGRPIPTVAGAMPRVREA